MFTNNEQQKRVDHALATKYNSYQNKYYVFHLQALPISQKQAKSNKWLKEHPQSWLIVLAIKTESMYRPGAHK